MRFFLLLTLGLLLTACARYDAESVVTPPMNPEEDLLSVSHGAFWLKLPRHRTIIHHGNSFYISTRSRSVHTSKTWQPPEKEDFDLYVATNNHGSCDTWNAVPEPQWSKAGPNNEYHDNFETIWGKVQQQENVEYVEPQCGHMSNEGFRIHYAFCSQHFDEIKTESSRKVVNMCLAMMEEDLKLAEKIFGGFEWRRWERDEEREKRLSTEALSQNVQKEKQANERKLQERSRDLKRFGLEVIIPPFFTIRQSPLSLSNCSSRYGFSFSKGYQWEGQFSVHLLVLNPCNPHFDTAESFRKFAEEFRDYVNGPNEAYYNESVGEVEEVEFMGKKWLSYKVKKGLVIDHVPGGIEGIPLFATEDSLVLLTYKHNYRYLIAFPVESERESEISSLLDHIKFVPPCGGDGQPSCT